MQELNEISIEKYYEIKSSSKNRSDIDSIDAIIKDGLAINSKIRIGSKELGPKYSSLWEMPWDDKIELEHFIKSADMVSVLMKLYPINGNQFLKLNVFNCFACFKWIQDQLTQIAKIEERELASDPSTQDLDSGIENLSRFGHLPSLEAICKTFNVIEDEVMKWPYQKVFMRLAYLKTKADIQQNLMNNAKRNAGKNSLR